MNKRTWPALVVGAFAAAAFAVYIYDICRVLSAMSSQNRVIPFDTGFGVFALAGLVFPIAIAEFSYRRKMVSSEMVKKWGSKILISLFILIAFSGFITSNWLSAKLKETGYTACPNPGEISRISIGKSLNFVKDSKIYKLSDECGRELSFTEISLLRIENKLAKMLR